MLFEPAYKSPQYTGASWSAKIMIFFPQESAFISLPGYFFTINFLSLCAPYSPAYNTTGKGGDVPGLS